MRPPGMWWCVTVIVVDVFGRCGLGVVDVFGRLGSCFGRWGVWALGMKHEFHDARFVGDWSCICLPHQSRVRMASRVAYGALRSACRVVSSAAIRPSMSEAAQYRYVSNPSIRGVSCGWLAQKRGFAYRARFASQLKAARWIAGRLGVSVRSLRIDRDGVRACADLKVSTHAGVTHSRGRWIARAKGKVVGRCATEQAAANSVAKALRVGVGALKKRRRGIPKYLARRLFVTAYRIFHEYVPGDYDSMIAHETRAARMFRQDSLLC